MLARRRQQLEDCRRDLEEHVQLSQVVHQQLSLGLFNLCVSFTHAREAVEILAANLRLVRQALQRRALERRRALKRRALRRAERLLRCRTALTFLSHWRRVTAEMII